jgi:hypothetical protein
MWKGIKRHFVLILLAIFSLALIGIGLVNKVKLNGNYAYVIGKIIKKEPYRSGGTVYSFYYSYRGVQYKGQNTDVLWRKKVNDLFFIKVLLKDSFLIGDIKFIEDIPVPYCLAMDSVPNEGWKNLPVDTCK